MPQLQEAGELTGTMGKDCNIIWFVEVPSKKLLAERLST